MSKRTIDLGEFSVIQLNLQGNAADEMSDARLIVWDEDTGISLDEIDLYARPVVRDDVDRVVIGLETPHLGSVTIQPEWIGKELSIEVSPSAVTGEGIMQDIAAVATRMKVPVG